MGGGEGRQLYLPESSVPLEQEWVIREGTAESLVTVLTASLPFSGHPGLLRGKTCPVLKGMSHWSDIALASRIVSSLGGRLPSLEGGETGRKCLWQMELTFSPLASCVPLLESESWACFSPRNTRTFLCRIFSAPLQGTNRHSIVVQPALLLEAPGFPACLVWQTLVFWQKSSPVSRWAFPPSSNPQTQLVL